MKCDLLAQIQSDVHRMLTIYYKYNGNIRASDSASGKTGLPDHLDHPQTP